VFEFLARTIRQEEIRGIQTEKEEVILPVFAEEIILYLKDTKKLLDTINLSIQKQFTKISSLSIHQQ
jgi:hypothetical protein